MGERWRIGRVSYTTGARSPFGGDDATTSHPGRLAAVISNAELDRRWTAVRAVMARQGIDWLIAAAGHPWGTSRWLTNRTGLAPITAMPIEGDLVFASHGDAVHHLPHDSYGVRHVASCAQLNTMVNTHVPLLVAQMQGTPVRRIGLAGTGFIPLASYLALQTAFPDAEFIDLTEPVARIKAIKSPEEMVLIRGAAAMHDEGVEIARRTLRAGITARDVVEEVRAYFTRRGSMMQTMMGGSAPRDQICRYAGPIDRVIEPGDLFCMLIECSTASGYYSEAMPTMCVGDPPAHLRAAFDHAVEIQELLVDAVRPGMLPSALLAINDAWMQARGYPTEHRLLGHSQGMDLVERPAFSPLGETLPIEHDMVLSIHPTVHAPQAWGLPNNMSFHVTAGRMERLLKDPAAGVFRRLTQSCCGDHSSGGCHSSMGLPSGSWMRAKRPVSGVSQAGSVVMAMPACRSVASSCSRSLTRKLIIHCRSGGMWPVSLANGMNTVGPALCIHGSYPTIATPRCVPYHSCSAAGSAAREEHAANAIDRHNDLLCEGQGSALDPLGPRAPDPHSWSECTGRCTHSRSGGLGPSAPAGPGQSPGLASAVMVGAVGFEPTTR